MGRMITVFGIIPALLLLPACLSIFPPVHKSPVKVYGNVVWADDASGLLVCWTEAELISGGFMSQSNFAHKKTHIEIWNPDGSLQKVVGIYPEDRWRSPLNFHCGMSVPLYFMKRAGYVIVDDAQISLVDGSFHTISVEHSELNPFGSLLPSPDGATIALRSSSYHAGPLFVTFFDSRSRAILGGPYALPKRPPWNARIAWSPDEKLIVAPERSETLPPDLFDKVYTMDVEGHLEPAAGIKRFRPETSSSPVSSTGKLVMISPDGHLKIYDELYAPFGAPASWKRNRAGVPLRPGCGAVMAGLDIAKE